MKAQNAQNIILKGLFYGTSRIMSASNMVQRATQYHIIPSACDSQSVSAVKYTDLTVTMKFGEICTITSYSRAKIHVSLVPFSLLNAC